MIVDEVVIDVNAGKGGDGCVSFRREKFIPRGGPDGGNGGNGANIYFVAVFDFMALSQFRSKTVIKASDGGAGGGKKRHGRDGQDLIIKIPVGTQITDLTANRWLELRTAGQQFLVAQGGKGGKGNFEFRSAQNQTPRTAEKGKPGQQKKIHLNMQLISDIGLIGLPNAGKSSLLNTLTKAAAKVGNYPFTTLEPNLGDMHGLIISDIPGLIEGAHTGKGLGVKFLKHIQKTKLLVHCIDITAKDLLKTYQIIRTEVKEYDRDLEKKPEIIVLTKSDLLEKTAVERQKKKLSKYKIPILAVSIIDDETIAGLQHYLNKRSS